MPVCGSVSNSDSVFSENISPGNCEPDNRDNVLFPDLVNFRNKHISNFVFLHNNLNSYRHKHAYTTDILCNGLADLVIYSETKLDDTFLKNEFEIDGFSLYRQDCTERSGGLLCHMRADIPHCRLSNMEVNEQGFESLILKVVIGDFETVFVAFYKHPFLLDELFKKYFCTVADNLFKSFSDIVFIGDGNCCPKRCSVINDLCELYGLKNLVDGPTCFKSKLNPSSIDVILVTNPRKYIDVLNSRFELSDFHNIVGASTRRFAPKLKPYPIKYRSYKQFIECDFLCDLEHAPFHVADVFDDVEDKAWFTSKLISYTLDAHAPLKTKWVKKQSAPFMNSELRKTIFKRNMARNNFNNFGKSHWEDYRKRRNALTACRKKSIRNYFSKNCDIPNKRFWPTISPFLSDKRKKGSDTISLNEGGKIVNEPAEVANIFNNYYSNIASTIGFDDKIESVENAIEKHKHHPSITMIKEKHQGIRECFDFHVVSPNTVKTYLRNFNPRKATGYDNIPGRIIKLACNELANPLTNLINSSIVSNTYPGIMKYAEINPVYKKEDRLIKKNFRPVSVLTGISKVFEYVMNEQLVEYFQSIFNAMLNAYRKNYSSQSLLLKLIEDSKSKIDDDMFVGKLLQDLSKAFDCLPHGLLIAKLRAYGLSISACELVASYLSDRLQRVKISSFRSEWINLLKGVPQGSVLGPLLFNVFINDLFYFVERTNLYNFADDNSLSYSSYSFTDLIRNLEHDSNVCIQWYVNNGMEASPSKFQSIVLSSKPIKPVLVNVHGNVFIRSESVVKALGVHIDNNLDFNHHAKELCLKASRQLNAFARIAKYLNVECKLLIFRSFIMSNFDYCSVVWHFCGKKYNDKIERIQKRALSIVFNDYDSDYITLLNRANMKSVFQLRINRMLTEIFKTINGINPSYLNEIFKIKDVPYGLRDNSRMDQPLRKKTNFGLRSVTYVGSKIWNSLPSNIKNADELAEFKLALRDWSGISIDSESFLV